MSAARRRVVALFTALVLGLTGALIVAPATAAPIPPAGKAAIFGIVTPEPSGIFVGEIAVRLYTSTGSYIGFDTADGAGAYEFTTLEPGNYRLNFDYSGTGVWADTGWAPPGGVEGGFFSLAANQVLEASGPLHVGGSISGTVSVPTGTSASNVSVTAYNDQGTQVATTTPNSLGEYVLAGLSAGRYRVAFSGNPFVSEYWMDASSLGTATPVTVSYGQTFPGVSPTLGARAGIAGTVSGVLPDGRTVPIPHATVRLTRTSDSASWSTTADRSGNYFLDAGPDQQEFFLTFSADSRMDLVDEYWNDTTRLSEAALLTNGPNEFATGYDVTLAREARITGRVRYDVGSETDLAGAHMRLFRLDADGDGYTIANETFTLSDGTFAFENLPAGEYVLKASDALGAGVAAEYWQDARLLGEATIFPLVAGQTLELASDIVLEAQDVDTDRISGSDRFSTGVAITKKQFPGSNPVVPVVYIASGLNYPDALSAGPAAIAQGGALLLVRPTEIPSSVATELDRLQPQKIVVVGSAASVSNSVADQLEQYVDSPSDVIRKGGTDRYETSSLVARHAFGERGASTAFFATGKNYPDALVAGPAAARFGAPVILVDGSATSLGTTTTALMADLGVSAAEVLGNSVSVSDPVFDDIAANLTPTPSGDDGSIRRHEGPNRYSTATAVNDFAFPDGADQALLTAGTGFADALSGGPLAGAWGIPMYLSKSTCVPQDVLDSIVVREVAKAWLLGSSSTLSDSVMSLTAC